jgi:hypothetical protein
MSEQRLASSPMPALRTEAAEQDIFAIAERLQDLAWTMRERDIETATCVQIEALAATILSASALRDPADRRAQRLGEALRYLQQRLEAMLAGSAAAVNVASVAVTAEPPAPFDPVPTPDAAPMPGDAYDVMAEIESELFATVPARAIEPQVLASTQPQPTDPLAALRTLSEEELIALFA